MNPTAAELPRRVDGDAAAARPPAVLVIGCGNLLCGDDGAGPVLVRRLRDRGLPPGVACVDCGTAGIEVAFRMRGVPEVIMIDACRAGGPPGTLLEMTGRAVEQLPPPAASFHAFRWDHALAFGRWLLGEEYPRQVAAWLIVGESFAPGDSLSPAVDRAIDSLCDRLCERLHGRMPAQFDDRKSSVIGPPGSD